ncbi:ribonuclease H-like domain-containing protein [Tanacetum coccineum]
MQELKLWKLKPVKIQSCENPKLAEINPAEIQKIQRTDTAYLLLYVDDIVLTASFEYAAEILERARMVHYNPSWKPVDTESRLGADGDPISDLTLIVVLQKMLSQSSEAKYRGVANAVAETCRLRNLLRELHTPLPFTTLVYCDNVSVVYLSSNLVQHQHKKHIKINIHFVRDFVVASPVRVLHVPSRY